MKKKPSIVVFEVNDNNRSKSEYGKNAGKEYFNLFSDFIASLGYDVESDSYLERIKINGHDFNVDTNNASYMSKNAFNRTISIRKPENRYILILKGYNRNLIKVQINKEYDANKLREKINEEINRLDELTKSTIDRETANINNTTFIAKKYIDSGIRELANSFTVNNGIIEIYIKEAFFEFDIISGVLKSLTIYQKDYSNEFEINNIFSDFQNLDTKIKQIIKIVKDNPIPKELLDWSMGNSNGSYAFKKLEYSKY